MKAKCKDCKLIWTVSLYTRLSGYICPYCKKKKPQTAATVQGHNKNIYCYYIIETEVYQVWQQILHPRAKYFDAYCLNIILDGGIDKNE